MSRGRPACRATVRARLEANAVVSQSMRAGPVGVGDHRHHALLVGVHLALPGHIDRRSELGYEAGQYADAADHDLPTRPIPSPAMADDTTGIDPLDGLPLAPRAGADRHPRRGDVARGARARRARRPGPRASTGCTTRRWAARWAAHAASTRCGASTSARPADPAPRPRDPTPLHAVLDEFTARIAPHTLNSYHPRALSYFTPPPLVASIVGEVLAQWTNQGIDVWHAGPVGAFVEEEVVRWLCDLVGYGEGASGCSRRAGSWRTSSRWRSCATSTCRALARRGAAAARGGARGRPRVHGRPDALLDRPRARRAGLPARDARRAARPMTASASTPSPSPRRSPRTARAGLPPVAMCAVAGLDEHGLGRPDRGARRARPARGPVVPRRRGVRRRGAALRARRRARPGPRARGLGHGRSAQVVLPGVRHRRAARPRRRRTCAQTFDRSPEYYRGGEAPAGEGDAGTHDDDHAGQLNFYKLGFEGTRRFRALKLWATWQHLGTSGLGRLIEANDDVAAYLAARCAPTRTTSRRCPPSPSCPSCASGTCRAARRRPARWTPREPRRAPGPARGRARGVRRRLAVDDEPARRDVAARRGRQLPHDRGRHRPPPRDAPAARRRLSGRAGRLSSRRRTSRTRCAAAGRRARAPGSRRAAGRAATGTPRDQPRRSRLRATAARAALTA